MAHSSELEVNGSRLSWWIFWLSVLFAGLALYLRHEPLASSVIDNLYSSKPLPNDFDQRMGAMWRDFPFSLFIILIGAVLTAFASGMAAYTQSAWSSITRSLEDYRDGLNQGILRFEGEAIRLLKYNDGDGILINTTAHDEKSAPRNVLLNNLTIQKILSSLRHFPNDALENVGVECGKGFGSVVLSLHEVDRDDLRALVFAWFKYDSNAGFGRFELTESSGKLKITLRHNFLTAGDTFRTPSQSLCAFMRGYIKGVLAEMPAVVLNRVGLDPRRLVVTHDSKSPDCICTSQLANKGCVFTITNSS